MKRHPSACLTRRLQSAKRHRSTGGFALAEVMVALFVLLVAIGGTIGTLQTFVRLGDHTDQRTRAIRAAEALIEQLHAEPFGVVFSRYNDDASDDPAGGAPGPHFTVAGLDSVETDADGFVGRVRLPVDPAAPGVLREDLDDLDLGTPLDLNLDGALDGGDRSSDHVLLPVRVEVSWRGPVGQQTIALDTILARR